MGKTLAVAGLVTLVAVLVAAYQLRHSDVWSPDGAIYLRMTMQDRGVSADVARQAVSRFMQEQIARTHARDAGDRLYSDRPPAYYSDQFALFANRPLYPFVSALLLPAFGPNALLFVSAAAYVLAVDALFAVLLGLTSPVRAGLAALVFGTQPVVLGLATAPLTDELALFFWLCCLGTILAYVRRPSALAWVGIFLAALALTFTRPAFFLPLAAAAGAFGVLRRPFRTTIAAGPIAAASPAAVLYFAYTAHVHGPSAAGQLAWQFAEQQALHGFRSQHGPIGWYLSALLMDVYQAIVSAIPQLGGIILLLLAAYGARRCRSNSAVRTLLAAAAAIPIAIFVNPLGVERPVFLPLAPIIVLLAAAGFERLTAPGRTPGAAP